MTYRQNYSDAQIAEAFNQGGSLGKGAAILGVPKSTFAGWYKDILDPEVYSRASTWEEAPSKTIAIPQPDITLYSYFSPEATADREKEQARVNAEITAIVDAAAARQEKLRKCGTIDEMLLEEASWEEQQPKRTPFEQWNEALMRGLPDSDCPYENSCILIIPDLHCPYQHKDTLRFLAAVKLEYEPTRVICLGDELDSHAMSFHTSDPDLDSAGTELGRAREFLSELEMLFPKLDLLHSNHGSMLYRRGKEHGIPKHMLKSYNDVLGVSSGWQWHEDLTLELPNGQLVHFHHGRSADPLKVAQSLGMSYVAGHYHTQFNIQYFSTPIALNWAMQSGCLIDDHSLAFAYNKLSVGRPILGCSLIIDSQPKLVPMLLDRQGNWLGEGSLCS
jgi:hypothetical protein